MILMIVMVQEVNEEALGRETIDASDFSVALDVRNSLSMDEGPGRLRVSSNAERPVSTDLSPLFKEKNKRRSSLFNFGKSSTSSQDMGMEKSTSAVPKKNKRRSSILNSFKSGAQLDAEEQERIKSKLRPPSYTDRILVHSICEEKLSIDAYGFCDSIRCSDHRPVSSSMSLTVSFPQAPEVCASSNRFYHAGEHGGGTREACRLRSGREVEGHSSCDIAQC